MPVRKLAISLPEDVIHQMDRGFSCAERRFSCAEHRFRCADDTLRLGRREAPRVGDDDPRGARVIVDRRRIRVRRPKVRIAAVAWRHGVYRPPVLTRKSPAPPQTSSSEPVQTAVWAKRAARRGTAAGGTGGRSVPGRHQGAAMTPGVPAGCIPASFG